MLWQSFFFSAVGGCHFMRDNVHFDIYDDLHSMCFTLCTSTKDALKDTSTLVHIDKPRAPSKLHPTTKVCNGGQHRGCPCIASSRSFSRMVVPPHLMSHPFCTKISTVIRVSHPWVWPLQVHRRSWPRRTSPRHAHGRCLCVMRTHVDLLCDAAGTQVSPGRPT